MDWIARNPHTAVAIVVATSAAILSLFRFGLSRHSEYIAFMSHMTREEKEVWPAVKSLHQEVTANHLEAVRLLEGHSLRIKALEEKMPNGEIHEIKASLGALVSMLRMGRGGSP